MTPELTAEQRYLLDSLPTPCVTEYRAAQELVALGLAHWAEGEFGMHELHAGKGEQNDGN